MKYIEFLVYKPKHKKEDKISDKTLIQSIIVSVFGILVCMASLFGLTWAWFADSVTVDSNKITAANFDLEITVNEQNTENVIIKGEDGYYTLDASKTYTVTLAKQGTAKTGFCILSVITPSTETATAYYTDSIPQIDETTKEEVSPFVFTVSGVSKIKFRTMWGKCPNGQEDKTIGYNGVLSLNAVSPVPTAAQKNAASNTKETATTSKTESSAETTTSSEVVISSETTVSSTEKINSETEAGTTSDTEKFESTSVANTAEQ